MRWLPLVVGALLSASSPSATVGSFELTGTVHAGGRPKGDAIVWLEPASAQAAAQAAKAKKVVLDQRTSTFFPHVLAVQVGTTVDLPNNDRVFHNVFSFTNGKPFDLGLYPTGASKRITLDRPAVNRLYCNIHPHMAAYIIAVDSPYYATADKTGAFTIRDVPAGRYTYHAWRSGAEMLSATVTVGDGQPFEVAWR